MKLINGNEVLEVVESYITTSDIPNNSDVAKAIYDKIVNLPAICIPSRKQGEWTSVEENEPMKIFYCSECKNPVNLNQYANECYYNYCPHCGVKMRDFTDDEAEESEEELD